VKKSILIIIISVSLIGLALATMMSVDKDKGIKKNTTIAKFNRLNGINPFL